MNSPKKQKGLTLLSLTFVIIVLGFFLLLILKIGPVYLNHSKVIHAVEGVINSTDAESKSVHEVKQSLNKRLDMNYVDNFDTHKDLEIKSQNRYLKITVDYEVVVDLFSNISALIYFKEEFEIGDSN